MKEKFLLKILKDCIFKRKILSQTKEPKELVQIGDFLFKKKRLNDAIDFYQAANYKEGFLRIKQEAIDMGDGFLLYRLQQIDKDLVTEEDIKTLQIKAKELQKDSYESVRELLQR